MARPALTPAFQLSVRAAVAAAASVATARYLHSQLPICALVTAVLVTNSSTTQTRHLALPRLAGTLLGAATGALLSEVMPSNPLAIGIGIMMAMLLSHLVRLPGAARVAGLVAGIILLHKDHPVAYAGQRLVETTLGLGFAVLVSFVPRLIPSEDKPPTPEG
jgi:uncharacterized membrane protein YgaE (UPF0421/DUF939 family)